MAHTASNMIAGVRAQFATEAHSALRLSHGHHFAYHAPPPLRRQLSRSTQPALELSEMMELHAPAPDPEVVLSRTQKKVATHKARLQERNNKKEAYAPVVAPEAEIDEIEEVTSDEEDK